LINFSSLDTHYSVNFFKLAPYSAHLRHISILTVKCPCNVFLRYNVTIIPAFFNNDNNSNEELMKELVFK